MFSVLLGKTLVHCGKNAAGDEILFETSDGERYRLVHHQDCCESVWIEDVAGDLDLLVGRPLLMAEEHTETGEATWTFYKLATALEYVTIRWCGESNGYYSERVDFERWADGQWVEA